MRTKLIVQVLMAAAITSLLGYLINQLPAVPDLPHKNEIIAGAVVVITLIAAAIALWQNSQPEEQTVMPEQPQQGVRSRSESLLLQAVKQEVVSRLDQSLHNAVFINLGKQPQPQQVKRPWDAEIKIGSRSPEPLPAETTILEVFDHPGIAGRLLILGEPGAGKTTTMLDLAKGLCDRAEQDANAFIPVLLNLSSWKDPKQTMTVWLVEELKSKYGVRKDIGTKWLAEKQLLPLLDGLDEVQPAHQESCVQAINRWLESEDRPPSLAVCCRREEYEKVVRGRWRVEQLEQRDETRMYLSGAILLQTLTEEQVQAYLAAVNQPELWGLLQQDGVLRELLRTPLWLSMMLLSYEGLSLTRWQQTTSTKKRLTLLLDAYVQTMLQREMQSQVYRKQVPPTVKQTRRWLIILAMQLQKDSQTEFFLEQLSPSWLSASSPKWIYRCGVIFVTWIFLTFIGSLLAFPLFTWKTCIGVGGIAGFLFTYQLVTESASSSIRNRAANKNSIKQKNVLERLLSYFFDSHFHIDDHLRPLGSIQWSWKRFSKYFLIDLGKSIIITIILILFKLQADLGLNFGSVILLILLLKRGFGLFEKPDILIHKTFNQAVKRSLFGASFFGGLAFLLLALVMYIHQLKQPVSVNILVLILVVLIGAANWQGTGGLFCIQHFVIRFILFCNNSIPWNYARFLDYCTERLLLQRVGGRYRFIHKSLQEHFASMRE